MERAYGWIKDKFDKRDILHRRGVYPLPDVATHADLLTPVRDQLNSSSCVGFGVGINLNSIKVQLGIYDEWSSPLFIYNGARFREGTLIADIGCHPREALEWTVDFGILLEHYWPYEGFDRSAPSTTRIKQADRYKGFTYWRAVDGVDGLCDALVDHFVSIGTPWFREWDEAECGYLKKPSMTSFEVGEHETCLYAYDRKQALFYGINSWGIEWGDNGLYKMPFEAIDIFKARGGYDAHYITFASDIDTTPIPEPEPSPCPWGKGVCNFLNGVQEFRGRKGRFFYGNP